MMDLMDMLLPGLVFLLLLNSYVSAKVIRSDGVTKTQKILQIVVIWAAPFVGGSIVFLVHYDDEAPKDPTTRRTG
jgi:hypothetical protein